MTYINQIRNMVRDNPILTILLSTLIIILSVLVMQFFFDINPCKMCYFQRYPYYVIIALSLIYFYFKKNTKLFLYLIALSYLSTASIAAYHVGIERNIISLAPNCASNDGKFQSSSELLQHLKGQQAVACDVPAFKFFLTLSEWNLLVAILLLFYTLSFNIKRDRKHKS